MRVLSHSSAVGNASYDAKVQMGAQRQVLSLLYGLGESWACRKYSQRGSSRHLQYILDIFECLEHGPE